MNESPASDDKPNRDHEPDEREEDDGADDLIAREAHVAKSLSQCLGQAEISSKTEDPANVHSKTRQDRSRNFVHWQINTRDGGSRKRTMASIVCPRFSKL